jgi:hypothetical protein
MATVQSLYAQGQGKNSIECTNIHKGTVRVRVRVRIKESLVACKYTIITG